MVVLLTELDEKDRGFFFFFEMEVREKEESFAEFFYFTHVDFEVQAFKNILIATSHII